MWQAQPDSFNSATWQQFNQQLTPIPFVSTTLEVDEPLWGGFWQGDVIAPGYRLPALELAYLRRTRLDEDTAETTPEKYLQNLQTSLLAYPDGAWLTLLVDRPALCVVYRPDSDQANEAACLIIWLLDGAISTAYWQLFADAPGYKLQILRQPVGIPSVSTTEPAKSLPMLSRWEQDWESFDQATKVDRLIQLHRTYSRLTMPAQKMNMARLLGVLTRRSN